MRRMPCLPHHALPRGRSRTLLSSLPHSPSLSSAAVPFSHQPPKDPIAPMIFEMMIINNNRPIPRFTFCPSPTATLCSRPMTLPSRLIVTMMPGPTKPLTARNPFLNFQLLRLAKHTVDNYSLQSNCPLIQSPIYPVCLLVSLLLPLPRLRLLAPRCNSQTCLSPAGTRIFSRFGTGDRITLSQCPPSDNDVPPATVRFDRCSSTYSNPSDTS